MRPQPFGEEGGRLGLPPHPQLQRLQPAQQEPGRIGGGDDPGAAAEAAQLLGCGVVAADHSAEQRVVVAGEVLRGAVQDEVGTVLQGPQVDGRGRGRVDDDGRGVGGGSLEIRHREERVGGRLQPDELDAFGRHARLVELDDAEAPGRERGERDAGAVVAALGERDRVARREEGQDERRRRAGAGREEERRTAVQLPQRRLGGRDRRAAEALVVEVPRLPVLVVGPERRPVQRFRHGADPTRAPAATPRAVPSSRAAGRGGPRRPRPRSSRRRPRRLQSSPRPGTRPRPTRTRRARWRR